MFCGEASHSDGEIVVGDETLRAVGERNNASAVALMSLVDKLDLVTDAEERDVKVEASFFRTEIELDDKDRVAGLRSRESTVVRNPSESVRRMDAVEERLPCCDKTDFEGFDCADGLRSNASTAVRRFSDSNRDTLAMEIEEALLFRDETEAERAVCASELRRCASAVFLMLSR